MCGNAMIKHGRSASGAQRWRCATCALTSTAPRADKARRCQLDEFLDWLLGAAPQRRRRESARNFRKRVDWCWGLAPGIEPDGVVHHTVMADGTYMNGWCLLVAIDGEDGEMLAWQWCDRESADAYKALFEQIAPPDVLICDGMKGIGKACAEAWPGTRIQRCLIHVQRDTRADLTSRPRLEAGRELKRLADALTRIHDPEHAARWGEAPDAWHERWKTMLAERTFAKDHPDDPKAATSTSGWWWTHLPLRRAYSRLERLFRNGTLFCFLDPELLEHGPVARDSNRLEGGVNAKLKLMLLNHRRLPPEHMRRACEWYCYMKSNDPEPARILKEHDRKSTTKQAAPQENDMPQPTLGTGIDWNEFHTSTRYLNSTD
ncbi:transposase [Bifidobacterium animalis subsp. animalis MCC 0499]|nr:transposase [Bifidobacterium animalis subsp. animalis MCC 0499]